MFKLLLVTLSFVASTLALESRAHAGACSTGFIEAYKKVVVEIKTIGVAIKANKTPTTLATAVKACNKLEGSFPGYTCEVGTQTATSADLAPACVEIREMAKSLNIEIPPDVPAPKTAQPNTPVAHFAPTGLALQIKNVAEFTKSISNPKLYFFIGGKVYDYASSVLVKNEVRCTIAFPGIEKSATAPQAGQVVKSNLISEEVAHDHYYTRITFAEVNWTLDCTKHAFSAESANTGITFGELKAAFGSNANFAYQN